MSDCGCGCGGSGGCGGDCGQPSKVIQIEQQGSSQKTFYKGSNFSCASDSSIDYNDGDSITSVLAKLSAKICALDSLSKNPTKGSYLAYSPVFLSSFSTNAEQDSFDFGAGTLKEGDVVKVRIMAKIPSDPSFGTCVVTMKAYGYDGATRTTGGNVFQATFDQNAAAGTHDVLIEASFNVIESGGYLVLNSSYTIENGLTVTTDESFATASTTVRNLSWLTNVLSGDNVDPSTDSIQFAIDTNFSVLGANYFNVLTYDIEHIRP